MVRLDEAHQISLLAYHPHREHSDAQITESEVRPYMPVRQGLMALIGRNAFYHLTEIGELSEQNGATVLTLYSGGQAYTVAMPID